MPTAELIDRPSCEAVPGVTWDRLQGAYAGVCAEVEALRADLARALAENRRLKAARFRGHTWRRDGHEWRCRRCGLRTSYPMRIEFSCAEWRRREGEGRPARKPR